MNATMPFELPDAQWNALRAAYATPPRAYHNFAHVQEVLRHYDEVSAGPGWRRPREAYLAVLYHDAIYEPGRRDNEARSAQCAREHIARVEDDAAPAIVTLSALSEAYRVD